MDSWALKAIEREAMARAERQLAATPMTFTWMGVSPDRLTWLIRDYYTRTGKPATDIDPAAPGEDAFAALAAEFVKPQFLTTTSSDGRHSLQFTYHGDEGRKRRDALHDAIISVAKAVNS